jgi:hypothetical protein
MLPCPVFMGCQIDRTDQGRSPALTGGHISGQDRIYEMSPVLAGAHKKERNSNNGNGFQGLYLQTLRLKGIRIRRK